MRKTRLFLASVTIALILAGCGPVKSFEPFYTYKDVTQLEERVLGDWQGTRIDKYQDNAFLHLHVEKHTSNSYLVTITMKPTNQKKDAQVHEMTWKLWANLFRYGGSQFVDLECLWVRINGQEGGIDSEGIFSQMATHTVYGVNIDRDNLRVRYIDKRKVEKFLYNKDRTLAAGRDKGFVLVGTTYDLQSKVLSHAKEENLYGDEILFVREKKESD